MAQSDIRAVTGDPAWYNFLAWATLTSSNENTLYPLTNVKDHDPSSPFQFNTTGNDLEMKLDLTMLTGRDFNTWSGGAPTGWSVFTSGTGSVTQDSVIFDGAGGSSAKLNGGASGTAFVAQARTVRAGWKMYVRVRIRTTASAVVYLQVRNRRTGKTLDNTMAWVTSPTAIAKTHISGAGAFETVTFGPFTVEDFWTVGADTCDLLFIGGNDQNADAWIDNWDVYPGVDFLSIHGHNVPAGMVVRARYSDDDSTYATHLTATPRPVAFYASGTTEGHRYWKIPYVSDSNIPLSTAIYYGEVILAQADTVPPQRYGWETKFLFPQTRTRTEAGKQTSYKRTLTEVRGLRLSFQPTSETAFKQLRDEWARRTFGGFYPMVMVPDTLDPSGTVLHGRLNDEVDFRRQLNALWDTDITIEESPSPSVVT